jgi:D-alanyl-D-alanine carboxypeptidase/D-alanyl-D-alanine-endopeptidase (penicillin-binding protein 4)
MLADMDRRAAALPLLVSTVVLTAFNSSTESSASPGETPGIQAQVGELP